METANTPTSKEIILNAAREVFAEKGFDGSRVDEIAKRAQVNKALIYYYFESKEQILTELIEGLIQETIRFKDQLVQTMQSSENMELFFDEAMSIMLNQGFIFFESNKDILTIVLSEALKDNTRESYLFKMFDNIYVDGIKRMQQLGYGFNGFDPERITIYLYFCFLPIVNFLILGEKWAEFNQTDYQSLKETFKDLYKTLIFDYFTSYLISNNDK